MNSSMIRTAVNGLTTFDLKTSGELLVNGLQMKSGGLVVSSGGVKVAAGGLSVYGGITLESGQLHLKDTKTAMKLSHLVLENSQDSLQNQNQNSFLEINNLKNLMIRPIISINDLSGDLSGDLTGELKTHRDLSSSGGRGNGGRDNDGSSRGSGGRGSGVGEGVGNYLIMETTKDHQPTYQLDSNGNIFSNGSMKLHKNLIAEGGVQVNGMFSLDPFQIIASDDIILPTNKAFIEILSDHKDSANRLQLPRLIGTSAGAAAAAAGGAGSGAGGTAAVGDSLTSGQLLILRNLDETPLQVLSTNHHNHVIKTIKIPSQVTVILIFNGYDWLDIQSLSSSIDRLKDIQELTFQNDIDVGNFTITSGGYRMAGINKGEVLVGGIGGALKGRKGLTYSNGILSTQGLKAQVLESDLDGNKKTIS
jgi:hypothetical protein